MSFERKIIHLPGTELSPEVVLHRTLTKIDSIKNITVVIQWKDDTLGADWSSMKSSELAMASFVLQNVALEVVGGSRDDA